MDKNFIQHQASSIKGLIDLLNYEFVSEDNTYRLIDLVKSQILVMPNSDINSSEIKAKKALSDKAWFRQNISTEFVDALYEAENFDDVCEKFVTLYNNYLISSDEYLRGISFGYNGLNVNGSLIKDSLHLGYAYNPELKRFIADKDFDFSAENEPSRYSFLADILKDDISFNQSLVDKGKDIVTLNDTFKTIIFNQVGFKCLIPLSDTFAFRPEHNNKQIDLSVKSYIDGNGNSEYTSEVTSLADITENNTLFNSLNKVKEQSKLSASSSLGINYIDKINKVSLLKSGYKFYALSSIKDNLGFYPTTGVNLIFNKERTVSVIVDGYDFYYAVMLFAKMDAGVSFDIYFDEENERIVFIGNRKSSVKVPIGFNQTTMQIDYDYKEVSFIATIPTTKNYPNVINEVWLFSYSLSTSLKDILDFTREVDEISKIKIPTDFLNQKEIITKEQIFKIESIEDKINKLNISGNDFLEKFIDLTDEYIQTYSKKVSDVRYNSRGNKVDVQYYDAKTDSSRFLVNGNINYDYVWKVNEKFWRYNQDISPKELIAFFIAKGDDYNYRLLSYRILGVDCYLFKDKLTEPLLIEGLLCVEDFQINIQTKSIEKPMVLSYKYEYGTKNYYEKRKKLRRVSQYDLDRMSIYPMLESILLFYGEDLGENIIQNQISFLESELVRPKELKWNSKTDETKLFSSPTDPIFLDNSIIKDKSGYDKLVMRAFNDFLGSAKLVNELVNKRELLYGYILRLPESISIPLVFIKEFNCFKVSILPKENPLNDKGIDVFAVFGTYDLKNEKPLFIGDDTINSDTCKSYIKNKPQEGHIAIKRNIDDKGNDKGTYAFSKSLNNLTDDSYINLYEGNFISFDEMDNMVISKGNSKKIAAEVLIAFNIKQAQVIKEGDTQFNKFMNTYVNDLDSLKMQQIWNETYNYIMYPKKRDDVEGYEDVLKLDNSKFPIFLEHSRFFKDETTKEFNLNDNQIDGIKFYVGNDNSSLLAHEVGFGKTTTAICSISHNFLTGKAKRSLISVPNPTYVNWISEMKGTSLSDGKYLRGLIPHVNIVELKNARKDVFIKYDEKTFTQTGGIKKYTKSQIQNIHNFTEVTSSIVKEIEGKVKSLYFTSYDDKKENYFSLIKFIEKSFDAGLVDWRLESFFNSYINDISLIKERVNSRFNDEIEFLENQENDNVDKINNNTKLDSSEKSDKIKKEQEKSKKLKVKAFNKLVIEFTNNVISTIKSRKESIFDLIGVYDECFLQSYSVIISTHEAIGQLRVNEDIAIDVSNELKDNNSLVDSLSQNAIGFDKLNIDSIIVDEIHNFNELFAYSKRQISNLIPKYRSEASYIRSDYNFSDLSSVTEAEFKKKSRGGRLSSVVKYNLTAASTSTKKATLYGVCKTLQAKSKASNSINIMLLSATPFVDDLFQMIGVFNMIRPFEMPISFYSNFLYQGWDWENDYKGETVLKVQTSDFKNDEARNNWIKMYSQFYTYDYRIDAVRPKKFVYPYDCHNNQNKYEDNCESNVYLDFSQEQYEIYENIGKYIQDTIGYSNIVTSIPNTIKVSTEINIDIDDINFVKDLIDSSSSNYNIDLAIEMFIHGDWIDVLSDTKNPKHKDILDIYSVIKDEVDSQLNDDDGDNSKDKDIQDINDASEIRGIGLNDGGTRALQAQDLGKKLSLSPYMVTPQDAKDGNINAKLLPLYGVDNSENILKSAINFVETSPKIYFCVKAIECLIAKHIENKEDITGQIIYMAWGQSFWYGGVKYNGMELIKAYLQNSLNLNQKFNVEVSDELSNSGSKVVKCGVNSNIEVSETQKNIKKYELDEIQIVSGKSQDALKKNAISRAFNEGKIKIIIGSSTIKEGINLQGERTSTNVHGNSTIYVLTAEYAPMSMMQLEGRIWRQGNPLENVRIVYPLIKNSIDAHIYSKLSEKIKKVKTMLEAGIYNFKETQFDKDIEGVSLALNTNIDEKIKILWSKEIKKIGIDASRVDSLRARIEDVKKKYTNANTALNDLVLIYNSVSKALQDYYLGGYIRADYSNLSKEVNEKYSSKKADMLEQINNLYRSDIAEWEKLKEANEALNKENDKKNKANEVLIKEKKAKKIEKIDFELEKPIKKDNPKYQPDYTDVDIDWDNALKLAKQEVIDINLKKVEDKVFTNEEITYYNPISTSMSYSEISSYVGKLLSEISVVQVKVLDSNEIIVLDGRIASVGEYWVIESKTMRIDYAFTKTISDNSGLSIRMSKAIKENNVQSDSYGMSLFKDFCKLFVNGGNYENVLSDYDALVSATHTISTIDDLIRDKNQEILIYNEKLSGSNDFYSRNRVIEEAKAEKIRKERELLTNMKQYILSDVNKFCETNKFIYIKGSLTEEQKKEKFKIKN